jgi:hypothetical protein
MEDEVTSMDTNSNNNESKTQLTIDGYDLEKMYGLLLRDSAEATKQHYDEYKLLEKRLDNVKKISLSIIWGLIMIILALIIC